MRWSPGLGAGSLASLGGEHAAPHAGKPGRCLLLALSTPTSRSPRQDCSPGGPPRSRCELTSAGARRRWDKGWHCGAAASATPHLLPLRSATGHLWWSCPQARALQTSLAPKPASCALARQRLPPLLRAVQWRRSESPASSNPRDRRATPIGARAHRAPLLPGGSRLPGEQAPRRRQAAALCGLPPTGRRCAQSPVQPRHRIPCPPCRWPLQSPGKVCAAGTASAQLLCAPPGPEAGVPATVAAAAPYPTRGPRPASRRRGRILLRRCPLSLRRAPQAGTASPPHAAGANLLGARHPRSPRSPALPRPPCGSAPRRA